MAIKRNRNNNNIRTLGERVLEHWGGIWVLVMILLVNQAALAKADTLSRNAKISLITIHPGDQLYSTFGHSTIRVVDSLQEIDQLYNYGTFDFEEPGFYWKFIQGKLLYRLSCYNYRYGAYSYMLEKRPMIEQTLNLTHKMKNEIYQYLEWNRLPENSAYLYDFFFDNCASRIRDLFEKILGDRLELYLKAAEKRSFRNYLDLYTRKQSFGNYGIDLALGIKADRNVSPRETLFLPEMLFKSIGKATINIEGTPAPLVVQTDTLLWFKDIEISKSALPWPAIINWIVLGLFIVQTIFNYRFNQHNISRKPWIDVGLFGSAGLVGVLLLFLWLGTDHSVASYNWNIIWAWPVHLAAAFLLLVKLRFHRLFFWYFAVNAQLMMMVVLGWWWWPQELHEASFPIVFALALRSSWWTYVCYCRNQGIETMDDVSMGPGNSIKKPADF